MSDREAEQLRAQGDAQKKIIEAAAKNQPQIVNSGNMGDAKNVGSGEANVGDNAHQNTDNKKKWNILFSINVYYSCYCLIMTFCDERMFLFQYIYVRMCSR